VRAILAIVAIKGYLKMPNYRFAYKAKKVLGFFANLFKAMHISLNSIAINSNKATFEDPISKERLRLKKIKA
jgi:hypothetical protein